MRHIILKDAVNGSVTMQKSFLIALSIRVLKIFGVTDCVCSRCGIDGGIHC